MSERPSMPRPGPPPGSGAAPGSGSGQASGSRPAPVPGIGAGHPAGPADGRQGKGADVVPGPAGPADDRHGDGNVVVPDSTGPADGRRGDGAVGVPGPPAPPRQPGEPLGERGATPQPDDGSRGSARTSPDHPPGGHQAPKPGRITTGDAVVDRALDDLDNVSGQPLDRHIEVGQQVHRTLQARLADIGRE
jgi:hypothetical protein